MNKITNVVIGGLAVIALVIGLISYNKTPSVVTAQATRGEQGTQGIKGDKGERGEQGPQGIPGKSTSSKEIIAGSVTGPDLSSPYLGVNGLREWYYRQPFSVNASTTCSFLSPAATSSARYASYQVLTNGSSSPIVIGWAAGIQATTTKLTGATDIIIGANLGGTITASSTSKDFLVPPNTYINYKIGSGGAFTAPVTGSCALVLIER